MLENDSLGKLQQRILRSFQWAGRAQVDPRREESFLLMAIALESLVLQPSDENIGYKMALRCAHLFGAPDVPSKQRVIKNVKELYRTRSGIVHSGRVEVSDSELVLLRHYLRSALYTLINRKPFLDMTDEKQLEQWFESRLLEVATPVQVDI